MAPAIMRKQNIPAHFLTVNFNQKHECCYYPEPACQEKAFETVGEIARYLNEADLSYSTVWCACHFKKHWKVVIMFGKEDMTEGERFEVRQHVLSKFQDNAPPEKDMMLKTPHVPFLFRMKWVLTGTVAEQSFETRLEMKDGRIFLTMFESKDEWRRCLRWLFPRIIGPFLIYYEGNRVVVTPVVEVIKRINKLTAEELALEEKDC